MNGKEARCMSPTGHGKYNTHGYDLELVKTMKMPSDDPYCPADPFSLRETGIGFGEAENPELAAYRRPSEFLDSADAFPRAWKYIFCSQKCALTRASGNAYMESRPQVD